MHSMSFAAIIVFAAASAASHGTPALPAAKVPNTAYKDAHKDQVGMCAVLMRLMVPL